jgi:hypothetical protein
MKVIVVGFVSPKTEQLLLNAQAAFQEIEPHESVGWIRDVREMLQLGIGHTPALIINTNLKAAGRVPSINEIKKWIEQEWAAADQLLKEDVAA